jgi:hypothetical protein
MSRILGSAAAVAAALAALTFSGTCMAGDPNTTGLPSYPHLDPKAAFMDATYRSIPNGQRCMHFNASTPDALAVVEAWYRKQMPNAKTGDINENSPYGSYFKLEGIKLLLGNDIVNVMRMPNDKATYLDLFKCKDAAAR